MLIQCLGNNLDDAYDACKMIRDCYDYKIKFVEVKYMTNINDGFINVNAYTEYWEALVEVKKDFDEKLDNIGIYYNQGEKIYIQIYKNAKVKLDDYKYKGIK